MNPDFIRTVDFFTRESPTRNIEKKNILRENPVEVRSFDGTDYVHFLRSIVFSREVYPVSYLHNIGIESKALTDINNIFANFGSLSHVL
jgi:hypothetical protein